MKNPLRAKVASLIEHRKEQVASAPDRNDLSLRFLENELTKDLHRTRNASDMVLNDILRKWSPETEKDHQREAGLIQFLTIPHDIIQTNWDEDIIISREYRTILANNSPNPIFNILFILTSADGSRQWRIITRMEAGETTDTATRDVVTYSSDTLDIPFSDAAQGFAAFTDIYGNTWWNTRAIANTIPTDDAMQEKINAISRALQESRGVPLDLTDLINSLMGDDAEHR